MAKQIILVLDSQAYTYIYYSNGTEAKEKVMDDYFFSVEIKIKALKSFLSAFAPVFDV